MPGNAVQDAGSQNRLRAWMEYDYTEITGLDDLNQPTGVIKEAEQLAAQCFGADRTFFLVQGSTLGNLALILSVCAPGDVILVDRFVHKSVIHGLMLANAKAVFLPPIWDPITGYPAGIQVSALEEALRRYPEAKALFLTRPNYYGQAADLAEVVSIVHRAGIPLLVDEAHGAHFGFHEAVPPSALSFGADAVVQSTHKMLSGLTMGAMLHIQGPRVDQERIVQTIRLLQTSSPSYPIMASLDVARLLMHTKGREFIEAGLQAVRRFEQGMAEMEWFYLASSRIPPRTPPRASESEHGLDSVQESLKTQDSLATILQDPFKQTVQDLTGTYTGYELQHLLEQHGCMVELADPNCVLLVFSPFSTVEHSERILEIFRRISTQSQLDKKELSKPVTNTYTLPTIPTSTEAVTFSRHMMDGEQIVKVPLSEAVGKRSAEMIIPYPPGIPFVYPGEKLSGEVIGILQTMARMGARFQGTIDAGLDAVCIIKGT
ncbi:arginine decarboxylase [Insulibacter thermoxylanivorax]|uniref:Arginine decarboxylase n=2 Tax=Insulibacter thermoxylanivorax TaxID=2749268 RepID=A0A916QEZ3_9BACL|nr:arginine decarboxylase [Insulibacter thermoxylanivorax]